MSKVAKSARSVSLYQISYPATPGATPTTQGRRVSSLRDARKFARAETAHRRDLTNQDVRIERPDGSLVEYAGPNR